MRSDLKLDSPEFLNELKRCCNDPTISKRDACVILGINNQTLNHRLQRHGMADAWLDHPNARRKSAKKSYDGIVPLVRELAADPAISKKHAYQDLLHLGSYTLDRILDDYKIRWIFNPPRHYGRGQGHLPAHWYANQADLYEDQYRRGLLGAKKRQENADHTLMVKRMVYAMCPHLFSELRDELQYASDARRGNAA